MTGMLLAIQDFDYFRAYARLDELKKYLDITEKYLQKAKVEFEAWSDERVKELPAEQRQEFYDFYQDDYWQYAEKFPRILRNSFLVSAHSLLEYEIKLICSRLKKEQQIPISLSDLKGDTILDRTKLYCKLAGLDFPFNDPTWKEIKQYSKVRNCIVHTNGLLKEFQDKDKKGLIPYLTKKGIISQDTIEQEIALTEQFCAEVVETIQAFLENLYKALVKK
jgi:hypothetical protein